MGKIMNRLYILGGTDAVKICEHGCKLSLKRIVFQAIAPL